MFSHKVLWRSSLDHVENSVSTLHVVDSSSDSIYTISCILYKYFVNEKFVIVYKVVLFLLIAILSVVSSFWIFIFCVLLSPHLVFYFSHYINPLQYRKTGNVIIIKLYIVFFFYILHSNVRFKGFDPLRHIINCINIQFEYLQLKKLSSWGCQTERGYIFLKRSVF